MIFEFQLYKLSLRDFQKYNNKRNLNLAKFSSAKRQNLNSNENLFLSSVSCLFRINSIMVLTCDTSCLEVMLLFIYVCLLVNRKHPLESDETKLLTGIL